MSDKTRTLGSKFGWTANARNRMFQARTTVCNSRIILGCNTRTPTQSKKPPAPISKVAAHLASSVCLACSLLCSDPNGPSVRGCFRGENSVLVICSCFLKEISLQCVPLSDRNRLNRCDRILLWDERLHVVARLLTIYIVSPWVVNTFLHLIFGSFAATALSPDNSGSREMARSLM